MKKNVFKVLASVLMTTLVLTCTGNVAFAVEPGTEDGGTDSGMGTFTLSLSDIVKAAEESAAEDVAEEPAAEVAPAEEAPAGGTGSGMGTYTATTTYTFNFGSFWDLMNSAKESAAEDVAEEATAEVAPAEEATAEVAPAEEAPVEVVPVEEVKADAEAAPAEAVKADAEAAPAEEVVNNPAQTNAPTTNSNTTSSNGTFNAGSFWDLINKAVNKSALKPAYVKVPCYVCNCGYETYNYDELKQHMYQHVLKGQRNSYHTVYETVIQ